MDSKLVIEQMAGRWKIKHADMKPLAAQAQALAPADVVWTWIPREQNSAADAWSTPRWTTSCRRLGLVGRARQEAREEPARRLEERRSTASRRRSSCCDMESPSRPNASCSVAAAGPIPGLTPIGEEQAQRAAAWIATHGGADAIVSSPLRRTRETAGFVSRELGLEVELEAGIAEAAFGEWDGFSFPEVLERWPSELDEWLSSTAVAPPGGEAFDAVQERVTAARDRLVEAYAGQDSRRRQPRDADQDDGAAGARCADAGDLQDGARAGVDHDDQRGGRTAHRRCATSRSFPTRSSATTTSRRWPSRSTVQPEVAEHGLQLVDRRRVGA